MYELNVNQSHRHGHAAFKEGEEVSVVVDEHNLIIDAHRKGEAGPHTFVTGKVIHVEKTKKEVKLQTPEVEKVFPLTRQEIKAKGIAQGTEVTLELNEAGAVIDLHKANSTDNTSLVTPLAWFREENLSTIRHEGTPPRCEAVQ